MSIEVVRLALEARREAIGDELEAIDIELDRISQEQAKSDADFLREARRELEKLIAEAWGPPINGER